MIVATNAFGMGVDKANVRSVWHMAIPTSLEAYYQEAGRGGRDGLPAKAVLLAMKADLGRLVRFIEQRGNPELAIARERGWRDFRTIKSFIYSDRCRRRSVLDHFGDREAGRPLGRCCDVCDPAELAARPRDDRDPPPSRAKAPAAPPPELSEADGPLFEQLKAWRLRPRTANRPSPSPTTPPWRQSPPPAPATRRACAIRGVGPSFIAKFAPEVLAIVAAHASRQRIGGREPEDPAA